uniref:Uncharacterized protein n=1 Tax=Avena sativa TaxID=4498 RepID=A0ACD5V9Q3_AVESA
MASRALSITALMAGVTLMLVAIMLVIFWALRRRAGGDANQQRATTAVDGGAKGLSTHELETLTCHDFFSNGAAATDCAVCLEAFEAGDRCRRLPRCEHSFHAKCVGPWLEKSRCCPVCRADVVAERPTGKLVKVTGEGETTPALTLERRSPAALEIVVRFAAV